MFLITVSTSVCTKLYTCYILNDTKNVSNEICFLNLQRITIVYITIL